MNEATILFLQKMIFIYNAVINGWTVKQNNGEFEFTKDSQHKTVGNLNDFLKASIQIPEELQEIIQTITQSLERFI